MRRITTVAFASAVLFPAKRWYAELLQAKPFFDVETHERHSMTRANWPNTTLSASLDELARAAADAPDTTRTRTILAHTVCELEAIAGISLGDTHQDSLVVLQRRLARAHRRLLAGSTSLAQATVNAHVDELINQPVPPNPSTPYERSKSTASAS